ncbi:MAG: DNA glycosylase [Clostridia bacterium]|nr:DNA glycosylase [Clostridia bacterium]
MIIKKEKNRLTVKGEFFSAEQILSSGQVFRFNPYKQGYLLYAGSHIAYLCQSGDETVIECSDEDYFYNYFDLNTDYRKITEKIKKYSFMQDALNAGRGIRILRQERLETLISFIISANNNIKRISNIIQKICLALGEKKEFNGIIYNAFPTLPQLSSADTGFFINAGAGYRAAYLTKTISALNNGFDLNLIADMDLSEARKSLMSLSGIGRKVCDCILLFSYYRQNVFPVDTWIEKVYNDYIECGDICRNKIADNFEKMFGNLSGYIQQYLFYYKRNKQEG